MGMNVFDYILLIVLAYFVFKGIRHGFVAMIGSLAGLIIGAWAAGRYYTLVAEWIVEFFDISIMLSIVIGFTVIFLGINLIVGVIVNIITHLFRFIPLATVTNRLIGAMLGFLQGLLLIGLVIWVINIFPFRTAFADTLGKSQVAKYFEYSTKLVQPLLPESLREVDFSFLEGVEEFSDEQVEYIQDKVPTFFDRIRQQRAELLESVDEQLKLNEDLEGGTPEPPEESSEE